MQAEVFTLYEDKDLMLLQEMHRTWPFRQILLPNVDMVLADQIRYGHCFTLCETGV